jgi:hypothetical protein
VVSNDGQLRIRGDVVQWRALHTYPWINLVSIDTLLALASEADMTDFQIGTVTTGAPGDNATATLTEIEPNLYSLDLVLPQGATGPAGRSVELRRGDTHLQWRAVGDTTWLDLVSLAELKGATGDPGAAGTSAYQQWLDAGNTGTAVDFLASLRGERGEPGRPGLNGGAAFNRATINVSTVELAPGGTYLDEVLLGASYRLMRLATDVPARVRAYATEAQRAADLERDPATPPVGDHGLQVDVVTTADLLTVTLSPTVDGWDAETQPDGYIPFAITNTGTTAAVITATITYLRTE